jgi:glycosyltransferase involved in cell wall biosynthesis
MGNRKRIALSYTYNEGWIGGTYYIENLVQALNTISDAGKPHIVLLTNQKKDYEIAKQNIVYPYISFQLGSGESNLIHQLTNKITIRLFKKPVFNQKIKDLDAVFPYYKCTQQSLVKKKIYWISDFQEHFESGYFSEHYIESRKKSQLEIICSSEHLIVSSRDALQHLRLLYPQSTVQVSVLPFAVTHPPFRHLNLTVLLTKFGLPEHYFICPNQFWKHKNQITVLKAVNKLKSIGVNLTVAFTGNTTDYRNPDYFNSLKDYVNENNLSNHIKFLGFIDRSEQLQLMNNAVAIIQPSLFEGWSTVVEDAKSLNKSLIVSDINIHKEQLLNSSATFFDPLGSEQLAEALKTAILNDSSNDLYDDHRYEKNIKDFGETFMKIIN